MTLRRLLSGLILAIVCGTLFYPDMAGARRGWNTPHWYIGMHGGWNWAGTSDGTYSTLQSLLAPNEQVKYEKDVGWGVSLGTVSPLTPWGDRKVRFEFEYASRNNKAELIEDPNNGNGSGITPDGVLFTSYMLNIFYDWNMNRQFGMYVGAGGGWSEIELDGLEDDALGLDFTDQDFAFQGMIGLAYEPRVLPNTVWTAGYRYIRSLNMIPSYLTGSHETEYEAHAAELGLRIRF